jgi:plasmid maintenance system antidote protein VapI
VVATGDNPAGPINGEYFMRPCDITPARLANETRLPLVHINEIIEGKRAITHKIAERFERCFGWPAATLLDWQLLMILK